MRTFDESFVALDDVGGSPAGTHFSQIMDFAEKDARIDETLSIKAGGVTGTGVTIDITPQFSYDKVDWFDDTTFTQITESTTLPFSQTIDTATKGRFKRYKIVIAGTTPVFTGRIRSVSKES